MELLPIVCYKCSEPDEVIKSHLAKSLCFIANQRGFDYIEPLVAFCRSYKAPNSTTATSSSGGQREAGGSEDGSDEAAAELIRGIAVVCDFQRELAARKA